ncbi:MAG: DUF4388 domain-containing protein [Deltaproteobacteria bacterium]|nr:DUF4388 domain-containing protein [Deltaproteobacteria bacterium]
MPLSDLLSWVQNTRRSGTLIVNRDGNEWELSVQHGQVTGYSGPELTNNLGHVVVTSGLLTEDDLRAAYQHQREHGGTLNAALVGRGFLTQVQLHECLTELACESIYDLFIDLGGEFVFTDVARGSFDQELEDVAERLPMDLDINHLLMEGARRQDEWTQIRERFPNDEINVRIIDERLPPIESLGVRERRILASLAAGQSISDICLELRAPIPAVLRALAELEKGGAVEIEQRAAEDVKSKDASRVDHLLQQAEVMRQAGQFDEAIALVEVAVRLRPDRSEARVFYREVLAEQIQDLYLQLPPVKVPVVVATDQKLAKLRLRPEEHFLLDRLEARMDIGSLIMVSSMNERETLKTLRKLIHGGIIELR